MNSDELDPATLAAFLEGTLAGEERERVLQLLAQSEDLYETMLEAVEVCDDLARSSLNLSAVPATASLPVQHLVSVTKANTASRPARTTPFPVRLVRGWTWARQGTVGGALLAAGLAIVMFSNRPSGLIAIDGPAQLVIDDRVRGSKAADWGGARGIDEALSPRARAFRNGARFADLELAFRIRDSTTIQSLSSSIANLAEAAAAGGATTSRVRYLAREGGRRASRKERRDVATELRSLGGKSWFDLGAWSATARRAAQARQLQFFEAGRPAMQNLDSLLAAFDRLPVAERAGADGAVARLRGLLSSKSRNLEAAAAALDSTIADLGH